LTQTLTQVRSQTLPDSHIWIDNSVFNQGITHTLRGSDWDARVIPKWCPRVFWIPTQLWFYPRQINNLFFILFVWGFNQPMLVSSGFFHQVQSGFKNWTLWVEAGQELDTLDAHKLGLVKALGLVDLHGSKALFTRSRS